MPSSAIDPVVLLSTHLTADVVERRSLKAGAVLEDHAALVRSAGVSCVVERVAGDQQQHHVFPTRDVLHTFHPPRPYNPTYLKHGLRLLGSLRGDIDESRAAWTLARSTEEIRDATDSGHLALVLGLQGSTPLEDDPVMLDVFFRLGVRVYGVAGDHASAAAGTYLEDRDLGLSHLGLELVVRAAELAMVMDLANLSERGFAEAADLLAAPFLVSSANARSICDHPANLDVDRLEIVRQAGGLAGLSLRAERLRSDRQPTVSDVVDHLEAMVDVAGEDHVAIGFDIWDERAFPRSAYERLLGPAAVPPAADELGRRGFGALPSIVRELEARGYARPVVRKILGANALRVFRSAWGA